MKRYWIGGISCLLLASSLHAAPQSTLQDTLNLLKHQIRAHEEELRTFREKVQNQDESIEALRKEMQQELTGGQTSTKKRVESLSKKAKQQADSTISMLEGYNLRFATLESAIEQQNQNIDQIKQALKSLMTVLQKEEELTYKVQFGDTLEKIAKRHHTTIRAIKESNQLKSDRIISGQSLIIPQE